MGYKKKRRRKGKAGCVTTAITLIVAVIVAVGGYFGGLFDGNSQPVAVEGEASFHFIDVGQADAALICTTEGTILIDAGEGGSEDELKAYLDNQNIKDIDYAIFTHPHEDHIGGADMIMETYNVKNVILPNKKHDSQTYNKMMTEIEKSKAEIHYAKPNDTYTVGDIKLTILAPQKDGYSELNDYSVVVRVDYGATSALFTGDAEVYSENEMLSAYLLDNKLDCDLLKVGHHGSDSSSSQAFLEKISPEVAVISCGKDNDYGHPTGVVLDRLENLQIPYYRTDLEGDIVFISNGESLTKQ